MKNLIVNIYFKIIKNKKIEIKKFIIEQKNIVGIGNIYASESLFFSKIHPQRQASSLTKVECKDLVKNIKIILLNSIKKGGSSIKDYKIANDKTGYFQNELVVYGKENSKCVICLSSIKKIKQSGRSSFFCAICQK